MKYKFVWDPVKERRNRQKHGVSFYEVAAVFRDPSQISMMRSIAGRKIGG